VRVSVLSKYRWPGQAPSLGWTPLSTLGRDVQDPHVAGHHVKLHKIHGFGFTESVFRQVCACIVCGFLGQSQRKGLSFPLGRFSQVLGLASDPCKEYQVPGFQRVLSLRGTVSAGPGIEMLSRVLSLCPYVCWVWLGPESCQARSPLDHHRPAQARLLPL